MTAAIALKAVRGRKSTKRASGGPDRHTRRNLNGLSPEETTEELEARKADARWAADERKAGRDPDRGSDESSAPADTPAPSSPSPGVGSRLADSVPSTGGGVVLGLIGWAIFRNYLNGTTGQWVNAKLFNKVEASK